MRKLKFYRCKTYRQLPVSEFTTSFIGDVGDIIFKGDDISALRVFSNALFSASFGVLLNAGTSKLPSRFTNLFSFNKINSGNGSWADNWATQASNSLRNGTVVSTKTVMEGLGADVVNGCLDYIGNVISEIFNQLYGKYEDYCGV